MINTAQELRDLVLPERNDSRKGWTLPRIAERLSGVDSFYRVADLTPLYPSNVFKKRVKKSISYSEMNTFDQCIMKYALSYVLGQWFFTISEEIFTGKVVHKFLEDVIINYNNNSEPGVFDRKLFIDIVHEVHRGYAKIFEPSEYSNPNEMVKEIISVFFPSYSVRYDLVYSDVELLRSFLPRMNCFTDYYAIDNGVREGTRMLGGFLTKICGNHHGFELVPEFRFELNISNGVKFVGISDLVVKYPDHVHILDYKLGNPNYLNWQQLFYYSLGFPNVPVTKYLLVVKEGKVRVNPKQVNRNIVIDRLHTYVNRITSFFEFYDKHRTSLQKQYNLLYSKTLKDSNENNYYYVPMVLMSGMFKVMHLLFSRESIKYPSGDTMLCGWCPYFSFCRFNDFSESADFSDIGGELEV
jgi:hypothetical protein